MKALFEPKSVVIIGASAKENTVGNGLVKNLTGNPKYKTAADIPFDGKLFLVNPNTESIEGIRCYKSLSEIKEKIDLAVIATPAKTVPEILKQCKGKVNAAVVISAGFSEVGEKNLEQELVNTAKETNILLLGPNCLGLLNAHNHLNASFAPSLTPQGDVAFISQSGALVDSIIDWANAENFGFSKIVSLGNMAGLQFHDFLEYLSNDKQTKVLTLYIEGLKDGRKFIDAAKKCKKPIIALKAGLSNAGAKAASSHTGSLAGSAEIYKTAMKQAGVILAESMEEMFDIAKTLAKEPTCNNNIAIITNAGGPGVLATDYCEKYGLHLVELKDSTLQKLENTGKMSKSYSKHNPLDLVGDAVAETYKAAIDVLINESYVSGIIIMQTIQVMTNPYENAKVIFDAKQRHKGKQKPIICCFMGGEHSKDAVALLEKNGIVNFNDPLRAVRAMSALIKE
ncbi:hypothetical protein C4573_04500 [Candidatus Woesearchaeota archaeon]|nr:MAG: hypothetical protein C4573_04500 [Candidatus Woesearchaeota archaeon]